ncbi:MAG: type I DNA topoisomerase [Proteobacteria bacterium]|nr:type I DNA topoisomerase [Pseudomonadota bacterium]
MRVTKSLVIVESPAKARTISAFLGKRYIVESSIGHIRDLPRRAADVPAKHRKAPWAKLGVDVDNDFRPLYVVDADKKKTITKLRSLLRSSDELLLATDEDREGESIAWHLLEVLRPTVPVKRMVFHEITRAAIEQAIKSPRSIDRSLVDAQEARRILDRLYGYEVSPVLWKKIMPKLSAGRVQSVATRMVVARERERMAFRAAEYWDLTAKLRMNGADGGFAAVLVALDDRRLATGKDFGPDGTLTTQSVVRLGEARARELADALKASTFTAASLERKPYRRSPAAPFMTSTLQQEAGRKLRFSSARTMRAAQRLYESGYITYMRTDSTSLAGGFVDVARTHIRDVYGGEFLPDVPRVYRKKVKNAQEAHEAIRPAGDVLRPPDQVQAELESDEARLYELIWKRAVASQMKDAQGYSVQIRLRARAASGERAEFAASGLTITFPGFLRAYVEGSDDPAAELENRERPLPAVEQEQVLKLAELNPGGHETQPPARFTEASLVRRLEELGVGRPSTYASIISTIQDRGYVWKKASALVPSFKAFAVVSLLEQHFGHLVDYTFTARMEDDLDAIANGQAAMVPWLRRFYFGAPNGGADGPANDVGRGLQLLVGQELERIDARAINTLALGRDEQGRDVVVRVGRYGCYLQRGDQTVSLSDDVPPDQLTLAHAIERLDQPSADRCIGSDPEGGQAVYVRSGRFGTYVQLGDAKPGGPKPKTASLLRSMTPETLTLEDALRLLRLPREVGVDPTDGQRITANIGRYGAYIAKGKDNRSLDNDGDVFSVTVEQALALLAEPRRGRRQATNKPLRELGNDPVSGQVITLRQGRFGPYVTDGETNASLRSVDDPDSITPDRAQELLQIRRERGPARRKAGTPRAKKATKTTNASRKGQAKPRTRPPAKGAKAKGAKKRAPRRSVPA